VFVEDRRSSNARFDDGRIEELVSGRDRGRRAPGRAGRHHRLRPTPPTCRPRDCCRRPTPPRARPGVAVAAPHTVALGAAASHPIDASIVLPETVEKRRKVDLLARADAAARESGSAITSVTAGYADARRRILVANSTGCSPTTIGSVTACRVQCVATGDTGMQSAHEAPGRTMGFELFDTVSPEEVGRSAARRALTFASKRCPRRRAVFPSS